MPGFNRTGPTGQGPMTGRKMGKCTEKGFGSKSTEEGPAQDFSNEVFGRGFGAGRRRPGRGLGRRNRFRSDF